MINKIKKFIQRGKNGFSNEDLWNFDYYLSDIISNGLRQIRKDAQAYPCNLNNVDEWNNLIDKIILTFDSNKRIIDNDWLYCKEKNRKKMEVMAKECNLYLMTKEECEKHREGWNLFRKYFFNLWI